MEHATPHVPQLLASLIKFVQIPLHEVWPDGQTQVPLEQVALPVQTLPHAPQFQLSDWVEMHEPRQ